MFQPLGEDSDGKSPSFLQHLHQEGGEYFHAEQCLMMLPNCRLWHNFPCYIELKSKVWPVKISFDFMTCFSHFILIFLYCFVYLLPLPSPCNCIFFEPCSPRAFFTSLCYCTVLVVTNAQNNNCSPPIYMNNLELKRVSFASPNMHTSLHAVGTLNQTQAMEYCFTVNDVVLLDSPVNENIK